MAASDAGFSWYYYYDMYNKHVYMLCVLANCHEYPEGEEMSTQQSTTMTELGKTYFCYSLNMVYIYNLQGKIPTFM